MQTNKTFKEASNEHEGIFLNSLFNQKALLREWKTSISLKG